MLIRFALFRLRADETGVKLERGPVFILHVIRLKSSIDFTAI